MTEVLAQTPTQATASAVLPADQGTPVSAPPAANNTTLNPTNPGAISETLPGAGGGVDLDSLDAMSFEDLVRQMPGDAEAPPNGQPAPVAAAVPTPNPPPAAALPSNEDDAVLPPGQIPRNIKVPTGDDPLSFHTARFYKESRTSGGFLTFGKAEALAKQFLGMPDEAADPVAADTSTAAPAAEMVPASTGKRSDELQQQLTALEGAFEEAVNEFDGTAQAQTMRDMNGLNRELAQAIAQEAQQEVLAQSQQVEAEKTLLQAWEANRDNVFAQFAHADAANPQSALHQAAAAIQQQYESSPDAGQRAISQSAESVSWYFQKAAQQLGIVPGAAPAPVSAPLQTINPKSTPPSAPPQRPVGAALISGGNTGTSRPPAAQGQDIVNRVNSVHDLEALIHALPAN